MPLAPYYNHCHHYRIAVLYANAFSSDDCHRLCVVLRRNNKKTRRSAVEVFFALVWQLAADESAAAGHSLVTWQLRFKQRPHRRVLDSKSVALIAYLTVCGHMSSFWSDACRSAISKPVQTLLDSAYASCSVTVRCADAAAAFCAIGRMLPCDT